MSGTLTLCPHFGACGGCSLQDMPGDAYGRFKRDVVVDALTKVGVKADVAAPVIVAPKTRRRAVFKIKALTDGVAIGFHAAKSHSIVDMQQCLVLTPGLLALVGELRTALAGVMHAGEAGELHVTESDTGFDAALRWARKLTPELTADLSRALRGKAIARLTMNGAVVFETAIPTVSFGDVAVRLPSASFLQASRDGEKALQTRVGAIVGKAKRIADLFSGLGTFALPLARHARVHAVEYDAAAIAALAVAAKTPGLKSVTTEARDLFKLPLTPLELAPYDAVVLDPPRAGAQAQAAALAKSKVPVIAYVSCNADSFARDAAILIAGGYTPGPVTPIDQFLWSSHIELVGSFRRGRA